VAKLEGEAARSLSELSDNDQILAKNLDGLRDLTFALLYIVQRELGIKMPEVLEHVERLQALRIEDAETAVTRLLAGEVPASSVAAVPEDAVVFGG
jgi:hypothetical protein